ncbi:MAG: hypothetical protein NC320_00410 [Clostridium sp.]|nr:hypothetical protein [Clostridium sp.]MCM1546830.1 hypothetical protein [Ruminococcus sp.]
MTRKLKRASILAVIIYVMINLFVWGLMKAYINSHNAVNHDKLVMAEISDDKDGKRVSIMGNSFCVPEKEREKNGVDNALLSLLPSEIKAVSEIFRLSGQEIVQEVS